MKTLADYLAKVPPEHATDGNFMAELSAVLQPFVDAQAFLASIPAAFDLDTAIGVQLDAVGAWAGVSRKIPIPVNNPWFALDTAGRGADQGWWKGEYDGAALTSLDDETYRRLIRARIIANNADGTLASVQAALAEFFGDPLVAAIGGGAIGETFAIGVSSIGIPGPIVFAYDATDYPSAAMAGLQSVSLAFVIAAPGPFLNVVDLAILQQLLIPVQSAGAKIEWAISTVDGGQLFGFDITNAFIAGIDNGAISATPGYVSEYLLT